MEYDDTTDESTSESEYEESFVVTDDDVEEELTWDSDDSRPAGPTPGSQVLPITGPRTRFPRPRILPSDESDSDETYIWQQSNSPPVMASRSPSPAQLTPPVHPPLPEIAAVPGPSSPPEIIEIPSSPIAQPPIPVESFPNTTTVSKPVEQLDCSVLSEGEEASLCTICMCPLTNSGTHRVVCLRCGHIFGQACVERWIKVGCNNGARRCPTCNKKAALKDIRVLYLPKVVPLDMVEHDRIMREKEELAAQKRMLEADFTRAVLQHKLVVEKYEERITALEQRLLEGRTNEESLAPLSQATGLVVISTVTISHDAGCRVMAFNPKRQDLVVSQVSGNTVFAGYGVRVLNTVDWQPSRFILLHSKAIRDLHFHPEDDAMLLSVSLDQNAKLFDLGANATVHTFRGEGPLWSCCWDGSHPHLLYFGSQSGKVVQYDRRMMDHSLNQWEVESNRTPVVALASPPCRDRTPFPQGGFLSCRLNAVYSYARTGEKCFRSELKVEGPFMSMRYDRSTQMMLTSSRPSSRSPHNRVCVSLLDVDANSQVCAPLIHTFNCGSSARVMSRSAILPHVDDSLVVAHNESSRTLDLWSSKRGDHLHSVPIREPVIDLIPVDLCNNKPHVLAALSEKKLTLYKVKS